MSVVGTIALPGFETMHARCMLLESLRIIGYFEPVHVVADDASWNSLDCSSRGRFAFRKGGV